MYTKLNMQGLGGCDCVDQSSDNRGMLILLRLQQLLGQLLLLLLQKIQNRNRELHLDQELLLEVCIRGCSLDTLHPASSVTAQHN